METRKLYYEDAYRKSCLSRVLTCTKGEKGWLVTLDQTVFYPEGGGQPCDLGTLGSSRVLDVQEREGIPVHLCDAPLAPGETVTGTIDWDRRFSLMQQHSGEHLVSGLIHRHFGYDNVGFHMGSACMTIDFSGEISPEAMKEIEWEANGLVWQNIPAHIFYPSARELAGLPYRSKKALTGSVRLVEYPGADLCACCGLHVARTGEVGLIQLLSTTRFHGGSRLELLCGSQALAWTRRIREQNRQISELLSAKPEETARAVERQAGELQAAQLKTAQTQSALFARIAEANQGRERILHFEEGLSPDGVRRLADALLRSCTDYCAVFSPREDGSSCFYAMAAPSRDLRPLARALNGALQGRGGGKPGFVQGSVTASREAIQAFFQENPL